jgi:hypothetical protein
MRTLHKIAIVAVLAGGTSLAASLPASADHFGVSIGIGGPSFGGDYDYYRPCGWYRYNNLPAPARCYRDFIGFYGPNVYVVDGFVFRNHDDWGHWRDRDEWNHWRNHEFRRADWHDNGYGHDNGWHRGWYQHDDHANWRDNGNGHDNGNWHDNGRDHDHDRGHDWHDQGDQDH